LIFQLNRAIALTMSFAAWMRGQLRAHPQLRRGLSPVLSARRHLIDRVRQNRLRKVHENVHEGSLVVSVEDVPGRFEMDVQSHVLQRILAYKAYEPELVALVREHFDPERDAIDVGANIGLYSALLSSLAPSRRVLAIEPTPSALHYLRRNLERNRCTNVTVFEGVVSDEAGRVTLELIPGREEYSTLGAIVHPSVANQSTQRVDVDASTIDALVTSRELVPGFIKIDVEGAELKVLRGAMSTLGTHRPVILCELSDLLLATLGATVREAVQLLTGAGYRVVDCETGADVIIARGFNGNVLALPR
jgi:FkbM family methyltransferase